jgi:DNA-binding IclR family transcriptional regulator
MSNRGNEAVDPTAGPRRKGIQSVEIGLTVLDALVRLGGPVPLSAVAQASGLSAPQAHRYLVSLIHSGMARQDPATGRYGVGSAALRLGLGALALSDPYKIADVEIGAFSEETGRTVLIAALGPMGPTIVRWHVGFPPVVTSLAVGSILPLLRSATGHAFLAFLPERETAELVEREQRVAKGLKSISVKSIRARVQEAGFAHVAGTLIPGLRATALPILDMQGRAILTATMLMTDAYEEASDATMRAELATVCTRISAAIGGTRLS